MNKVIELIQQKYGDLCQLCPPLDGSKYHIAERILPVELYELLKISNGVLELMSYPKENAGKPFVISRIIYSFDEMCSESRSFNELYGMEGLVIAGNGAGGYYIMNDDGTIYLYEYVGEDGEYYADNIRDYIFKLKI